MCLLLSALVLIVVLPVLMWFLPNKVPHIIKPYSHCDFYQYYAGAVVVRQGIWDSLYPIPKPEVYDQPNHFVPIYRTFLFNPATASTNPAFYPILNMPDNSDCAPQLVADFPGFQYRLRYIYPPPTALLVAPLSLVSVDCAANRLWPTLSLWSLFVLTFLAARIHRLLRQRVSYTEGLLTLACLVFSFRGQTQIPAGNVAPMLAALIALACYSLARGRLLAFSCAYIPLLLFKTIGLTWLLLFVINRAYWRVLFYVGVISLLLNGIVIGLAGFGVYEKFFALLPKIGIPVGEGIMSYVVQLFGFYPHTLYLVINLICLGLLYYGYWRNELRRQPRLAGPDSPLVLVSFLAGSLALFCLLNFSSWLPYCANYLFFPFLGWIVQEGYLASGTRRYVILGGTFLGFIVLTGSGLWYLLFGASGANWYYYHILTPSCILLIPLFFLIVALRRLLSGDPAPAPTPSAAHV